MMWLLLSQAILLLLASAQVINGELIIKQNGDNVTFECEVRDDTIKWRIDGRETPQTESKGLSSVFTSKLTRNNLTDSDAGEYECYHTNTNNASIIKTFKLVILSFSGESKSLSDNSTLLCKISYGGSEISTPNLMWKRKGEVINNGSEKYDIVSNQPDMISLIIKKPEISDAGLYICAVNTTDNGVFEHSFGLNTPAEVYPMTDKLRSKVEGEKAIIVCNVTGFPTPEIKWFKKLEDKSDFEEIKYDTRVNTTTNDANVPNAKLVIRDLEIKTDRGEYRCVASNELGIGNFTIELKVKDKLAAVWPFLGICAEVVILCSIIFIFEKRRNRRMEEEEEVDTVKQELMNQSNGTGEDKEVRQRTVATKA